MEYPEKMKHIFWLLATWLNITHCEYTQLYIYECCALGLQTSGPGPATEVQSESSMVSGRSEALSLAKTATSPLFWEKNTGRPAHTPPPRIRSPAETTEMNHRRKTSHFTSLLRPRAVPGELKEIFSSASPPRPAPVLQVNTSSSL